MPKKFYGVQVSYATVSTFYNNAAYPDFDSFIFQQRRDTSSPNDKDYTLIAWPVDKNGILLDGARIIDGLPPTNDQPIKGKLIDHANLKLNTLDLNYLYKDNRTSDLYINPTHYYKMPDGTLTNYMAYEAITYLSPHKMILRKQDLNPSPPA